jgi:hypothetical protein
LYYGSESPGFDFIKKQGENNRHGKAEYKAINTKQSGISQEPEEIDAVEKILKMLKPDPGAAGHAPEGIKVLKRDKGAVHGHVMENKIVNNGGKKEKVQGYVTGGKDSFFSGINHSNCFLLKPPGIEKLSGEKTPDNRKGPAQK